MSEHHITGIATKYDYRDALDRVERLREWYESDPEGGEIELPDIDRCLPKSVNRQALGRQTIVALAPTIRTPLVRQLMELAIELDCVSRQAERPEIDDETRELLMDCGEPVPALWAVFEQHDSIEGCFDEDCQTMLEVTPAPNLIIPFRVKRRRARCLRYPRNTVRNVILRQSPDYAHAGQ